MQLKKGVTTTEFWLVAGGGIAATALSLLGLCEGETAVTATAAITALYAILRAALKKQQAQPPK